MSTWDVHLSRVGLDEVRNPVRARLRWLGRRRIKQASPAAGAAGGRETTVVTAAGRMTGWQSVAVFHAHCTAALKHSDGLVVLDLAGVDDTDSKLLSSLLVIVALARARSIRLEIRSASVLEPWMSVYRVEASLRPVIRK